MPDTWGHRIRRAADLAGRYESVRPLLDFYAALLTAQKALYEQVGTSFRPTGSLADDCEAMRGGIRGILQAVAAHGPEPLAAEARGLLGLHGGALDAMLLEHWRAPSDRHFFAKAILQPYAQRLAEHGISPADRRFTAPGRCCPFCGGAPQLAVLDKSPDTDGAGRQLVCGTCLMAWPCRRVVCVHCGEEDERQLACFESPAFDHLRVDACDSCGRYLKTVDRTRLGLAVPVVDEVAGAALDLWARDRGYEKIELNLVGL